MELSPRRHEWSLWIHSTACWSYHVPDQTTNVSVMKTLLPKVPLPKAQTPLYANPQNIKAVIERYTIQWSWYECHLPSIVYSPLSFYHYLIFHPSSSHQYPGRIHQNSWSWFLRIESVVLRFCYIVSFEGMDRIATVNLNRTWWIASPWMRWALRMQATRYHLMAKRRCRSVCRFYC